MGARNVLNAKNGRVALPAGGMDYIRFGRGERTLVMLPGVGDGLKTVRGAALPFALLYRRLARDFTVYMFSRRETLTPGMTTRDMATDLNAAMDALGLADAAVVGVSQGGMIAQWLAIDHPERVSKLVLTVTLARPNPTVQAYIAEMLELAKRGDYRGILMRTAELSYSPKRMAQARRLNGLIAAFGKPRSFERFIIQAESCLTHDAFDELHRIACPTLVLGGTDDHIVSPQASLEIAERVPNCQLHMYDGLGHGLYEEAQDFIDRVAAFSRDIN